MDDSKEPLNIFCLKLNTGETLFSEVLPTENDSDVILKDPFAISYIQSGEKGVMSGDPWLPYSNSENAKIKSSMVFYCDRLNANYVKFYAHILIQFKVADIKTEVMEGMNISNDYVTMMNGVEKIKEVSNAICERFGILNVLDFTAFEEAAAKFKPVMH